MVASASLILLYSFLYSDHTNLIQVFGFLPFPCPARAWSLLSVWTMSKDITAFVSGQKSAYEGEQTVLGLLSLNNFT
jgi:hypothetical protein